MRSEEDRLDGWKAIALYLKRSRSAVIRWAEEDHLPVRRVGDRPGGAVYAYVGEIEAWLKRSAAAQASQAAPVPAQAASAESVQAQVRPTSRPWRVIAIATAAIAAVSGLAVWLAPLTGLVPAADPIPRSITWTYNLGKRADAPNGLRFWNSWDGRVWTGAFADGRVREALVLVSRFRGPNGCDGALLRRDRSLIIFVPNQACPARQLFAQDIDPVTGLVLKDWFVLGVIASTSPTPQGLRSAPQWRVRARDAGSTSTLDVEPAG